jgi:hypothetical protein
VVIFQYGRDGKSDQICAEPAPDAADQIASALSAALQTPQIPKVELGYEMATTVKQLFRRTQALQLFRDRSFYLCMLWMNRVITDPKELRTLDAAAFTAAVELLSNELVHFYKHAHTPEPTPPPVRKKD